MDRKPKKWTRRDWLLRGCYAATGGVFAYGSLFERLHLRVERVACPLSKRHAHLDGLRIGFLADFHYDDFGNETMMRRAVRTVNEEAVDLVILGGDYVSTDPDHLEPLAEILQDLRSRLGVFGIFGNHEYHYDSRLALKILGDTGVRFLVNAVEEFENFSLVGQDSAWEGTPNLAVNLRRAEKDKPIVLGWHEPDTFDFYKDPAVVLQLSGHSHGGQVCAPFYGPLLLPHLAKKYPTGLYRDGERHLYVSRGLGTLNIPVRLLCPPEVTIVKFSAA